MQRRLIKCVDTKAEAEEEVDSTHCDHVLQPASTQKCNIQACERSPLGEFIENHTKHHVKTFLAGVCYVDMRFKSMFDSSMIGGNMPLSACSNCTKKITSNCEGKVMQHKLHILF